ncbi:universal stress protein family domain protein [Phlyctema vagabunda]|uniref:Universal stress protein family domain protein n=1 Tax=Phlyctema vagabunda TaxID=108571 RepID=A0ABR4PQT8_9HELO
MSATPPAPPARSISIAEPPGSPGTPLTSGTNDSGTRMDTITEHVEAQHTTRTRAKSVPSLSFAVGKGKEKQASPSPSPSVVSMGRQSPNLRPRTTSPPPPQKFQTRVSFDLMRSEEPSPTNTVSYTLNVKHEGYAYKRRSRTFMVGIDDNPYSESALQWLLEELVDDGDQIVCLRVIDRDAKIVSDKGLEKRDYEEEAKSCMEGIKQRNDEHRAINIILEYAVGKLDKVFSRMMEIYEPAMLIVGTRGRSLGGFQGLMAKNSFSRWCLQYSLVPVVVVRPVEKRHKKKQKRRDNPARQDYAQILLDSGVYRHESEVTPNAKLFEAANDPNAEATAVHAVLGLLPPQFDPPSKVQDLPGSTPLRKVHSADTNATETTVSRSPSPALYKKETGATGAADEVDAEADVEADAESGDDSGNDSSEDEFEAIPGDMLLNAEQEAAKKRRLHDMEVGEAAALAAAATRKDSIGSESSSNSVQPLGDVGEAALLAAAARKASIGSQSSVSSIPAPTPAAQEVQEEDAGNITDTTVKPEGSEA